MRTLRAGREDMHPYFDFYSSSTARAQMFLFKSEVNSACTRGLFMLTDFSLHHLVCSSLHSAVMTLLRLKSSSSYSSSSYPNRIIRSKPRSSSIMLSRMLQSFAIVSIFRTPLIRQFFYKILNCRYNTPDTLPTAFRAKP